MTNKNENLLKKTIALSPLFVSCVLLAAQWGSVTTKMELFGNTLRQVIDSVDKTNDSLNDLQNDMAYIKGKMKVARP